MRSDRIVLDRPGVDVEPKPPATPGGAPADFACEGWSTPALTLRSASVRGDGHRYYGQPRQDFALSAAHAATGTVVFTVADGVSSASFAHLGAAEACKAAVQAMLVQLDRGRTDLDLHAVASFAAQMMRLLATTLPEAADPPSLEQVAGLLATTLVAGVARPGPDGTAISLFRIGDSGAWLLDPRSGFQPLFDSKTGSDEVLVSQVVTPLPWVPRPLEEHHGILREGTVLLVGTDGFGDPLGDGAGRVGALFAQHLAVPPAPLTLAHVLDFSRETFDDDRTLLALWPRGGTA